MHQAAVRGPGRRRHIPPAIFLLGVIVLLVAFARPVAVVTLPARENLIILAIDVSGSMRAQDVKPDRITAAKEAAKTFIDKQPLDTRIGVVAFSGNAALVQAPTSDHVALYAAIDRLTLARWTAIGSAIFASLDAIFENPDSNLNSPAAPSNVPQPTPTAVPHGQYESAIIILLSDGQSNTGPSPITGAEMAERRGVRVYTVGVGTTQGASLGVDPSSGNNPRGQGTDPFGGGGGFFGGGRGFRTFLDEETLKKVAELTDAKYFYAKDAEELRQVYQNLDTHTILRTQRQEITALFTAVGAVLMFVSGAVSLFWFNRLP
jgi:Ca-activated chloride channel family protein